MPCSVYGLILLVSAALGSSQATPSPILGGWSIGKPFSTPGPVGIDASQERSLRKLRLAYFTDHLQVCDKAVPTKVLAVRSLASHDFLAQYGFLPTRIGMGDGVIADIKLSASNDAKGCDGAFQELGLHALTDGAGRVVLEVANAYYSLKRDASSDPNPANSKP